MKILIVEDSRTKAKLMEELVKPLKDRFPGSSVILAERMVDALAIIMQDPSPDIVMLDLSLPDSNWKDTILKLDEIEDRAPVVIVTAHPEQAVRDLMEGRDTPIVDNGPGFIDRILTTIIRAIIGWRERKRTKLDATLDEMRRMLNEPAIG